MNPTRVVFVFFFWLTVAVGRAEFTEPGWFANDPDIPILFTPSLNTNAHSQNGLLGASIQTNNVPLVPVAEAVTPRIQALADGLEDDPVRIFDYVHDHIKFCLYFGSKKGADLTLLERSGNDFDQCALLVALLRAAGHTNVSYQFAWMWMPFDDPNGENRDLRHWWQLTFSNTNWTNTVGYLKHLLGLRGYPAYYDPGDGNYLLFQRLWVSLNVNGVTYNLDPAFKVSEQIGNNTLTNALGASGLSISNSLLSSAGGTDNGNFAQSLSEVNLRGRLTGYTTNLLNYLQSNAPNSTVEDLIGGWVVRAASNTVDFSTETSFETDDFSGVFPTIQWANEPTNIMSTLKFTFAGTNYQFFMPQLQGSRLALTFDNSGTAQLWQDDTLLAQHGTGGNASLTNVVIFAHHPAGGFWNQTNNTYIDGTFEDHTVTNTYQRTNASYSIIYAFEPDWGWLRQRQNLLEGYVLQGLTNGSRQVVCETLNIMGLNWMLQTDKAERMLGQELGVLPQYAHRIGRMGQESGAGYYIDVYMQISGHYPSGGDGVTQKGIAASHVDLCAFFFSAFEHGVIEQLQTSNLVAASTVKMLQIANTNTQPVYLASSTNWTAGFNVKSNLTHYDAASLDAIKTNLIDQSYYVLLPKDGSNHVSAATSSWAGFGYEAVRHTTNHSDFSMIIKGGYHGGYASDPGSSVNSGYTSDSGSSQPGHYNSTPTATPAPSWGDPVDLANGTFEIETTDLVLDGSEPRGMTFMRHYNGARRLSNAAGMGPGWLHNYLVVANNVPAAEAGLGGTTPAQAAAMLTATAAAVALYNGSIPNPKNWLIAALISKWAVDQNTKNGVSVALGKDTLQFVQQPNGTYIPPANCTWTLSQSGGAYNLTQRHGNAFNFSGLGLLTNIVDQYGQSMSLTYTNNNWVSRVKDSHGRTLTFNYSGSPSRLVSVSDGTRSVNYGYSTTYSPQGDLVAFTNAERQTSTYLYDTNHQIIATRDALNRLVVTNQYDTQGHLKVQLTEGNTNKTWRVYWSGWQTVTLDPASARRDYFYDDSTRLIRTSDELSRRNSNAYDGQNHIVQTVSPMLATNRFVYDANHNLTQSVDPLNFTNRFIFDSQNNLVYAIDARGSTNGYGYNAQFSLTGSTNGAGDYVNYTYNSDGTMHTKSDSAGTNTYSYNTNGMVQSITFPGNLGGEGFMHNVYGDIIRHTNALGFVTTNQFNLTRQLTNTAGPSNVTTKTSYDPVGNLTASTDARGNTTSNSWNVTKHLLSKTLPPTSLGIPAYSNLYDNRDLLVATFDPYQRTSRFTNDAASRLVAQVDQLGRLTGFGYDNDDRQVAVTNGANEVIKKEWSLRGEVTNSIDNALHTIKQGYDPAGNRIALTNRNGKRWQFQFDGANRLTNTISPVGFSNSQTFNHQGLIAQTKDQAGHTTTFNYDAKGWLTNRSDSLGSVLYRYDVNGSLTNVAENGLTNAWTYDAYGRASTYKDCNGYLIQYRYDANGNLTNLVYPGNRIVAYVYDNLNRLTNVTDWASRRTTLGYDLAGRLTSIARPNGTQRVIAYDGAGQATNILEQTASGFPIALFRFNYNSNATMQWEFATPLPHTNAPPSRTMTYDFDNRLQTVGGSGVSVDANGNLSVGPGTNSSFLTYSYDVRNRLIDMGGVTNTYDPSGDRIAQTYGTTSVGYVVNPNASLPQVLVRVKGIITNFYIYGPGLLYEIAESPSSTNTLTYHFDYRGSTVALSASTGRVTERIEYSAYGSLTYRSGFTDTPFLFNGAYGIITDPNGLLFMRARYYNPYICRFINADPSRFEGGLNFYTFANNNPILETDPSGLFGNIISGLGGSWPSSGYVPGGAYYINYLPPAFSHPFSFGIQVAVQAESGAISGAGGTYGFGVGLFYTPNEGFTLGGFHGGGAFIGGYGSTLNLPSEPSDFSGVIGSSAGIGMGPWFSNAGTPAALGGPFSQVNINASLAGASYATSEGIWIYGLTLSPEAASGGISVSTFPTTTVSAGGYNLITGQPNSYSPNK
jgi:RHS repeat-associated protein